MQCERCGCTFGNPLQRRQHARSCTGDGTPGQSARMAFDETHARKQCSDFRPTARECAQDGECAEGASACEQWWRVVHDPIVYVRASPLLSADQIGWHHHRELIAVVDQRGPWIKRRDRGGGWMLTLHDVHGELLRRVQPTAIELTEASRTCWSAEMDHVSTRNDRAAEPGSSNQLLQLLSSNISHKDVNSWMPQWMRTRRDRFRQYTTGRATDQPEPAVPDWWPTTVILVSDSPGLQKDATVFAAALPRCAQGSRALLSVIRQVHYSVRQNR